jgi:hypothetical protein
MRTLGAFASRYVEKLMERFIAFTAGMLSDPG